MSERISLRQLFFITFLTRSTLTVSELPVVSSYEVGPDVWITAIVSALLGPCIVWVIMTLAIRFPHETFVEYAPRVLGTAFGKIVTLFYIAFLLHHGAVSLRVFGTIMTTATFEQTPLVFIMGLLALVVAMGARYGIEAICRLADLATPLFVLATLTILFAAIPLTDTGWLHPVLENGFRSPLVGAITPVAIYVHYFYLLMLVPHVKDVQRARSVATWGSLIAGLLTIAVAVMFLLTYGPWEMHRSAIPVYGLSRLVSLGDFYERIDAAALFAWNVGLFIDLCVFLYVTTKAISQWLGVPRHRPLVFPIATIGLCIAMTTFADLPQFRTHLHPSIRGVYLLVFVFPIVLLVWSVAAIRQVAPKRPQHVEAPK